MEWLSSNWPILMRYGFSAIIGTGIVRWAARTLIAYIQRNDRKAAIMRSGDIYRGYSAAELVEMEKLPMRKRRRNYRA